MRLTDDELPEGLREERPSIDAEFAAMLDERAAGRLQARALAARAQVFDRLRAVPPRRILAPAGAVATLLVVAGVSISTLGGENAPTGPESASTTVARQARRPPPARAGGSVASPAGESALAAPAPPGTRSTPGARSRPRPPGRRAQGGQHRRA